MTCHIKEYRNDEKGLNAVRRGAQILALGIGCLLLTTVLLRMIAHGTRPAYLSGLEQPVCRVESTGNALALTFDSGFGGDCTLEVLAALAESQVKCTFFVTGDWLNEYPDKAERVFDDGHELASHSTTHARMAGMDVHAIDAELEDVNGRILAITGAPPVLFRAPYDAWDDQLTQRCKLANMVAVSYSVDAQNWRDRFAAQARLLENVIPGDIVRLSLSDSELAPALPELILALRERGFALSTVSDMLPGMPMFS